MAECGIEQVLGVGEAATPEYSETLGGWVLAAIICVIGVRAEES